MSKQPPKTDKQDPAKNKAQDSDIKKNASPAGEDKKVAPEEKSPSPEEKKPAAKKKALKDYVVLIDPHKNYHYTTRERYEAASQEKGYHWELLNSIDTAAECEEYIADLMKVDRDFDNKDLDELEEFARAKGYPQADWVEFSKKEFARYLKSKLGLK